MRIIIFGLGCVGISNYWTLKKVFNCYATDIEDKKINKIKKSKNFLIDIDIKMSDSEGKFIYYKDVILEQYDAFILALPTDLNKDRELDTSIIEKEIKRIRLFSNKIIIIRSTISIGFTNKMNYKHGNVVYIPEFISEKNMIEDEFNPYINLIGCENKNLELLNFVEKYKKTKNNNSPFVFLATKEVELIKLSNNSFLALRVAFINELAMLADAHNLDIKNIMNALKLNPVVGGRYLKPSSGFGGYCLPKDSINLFKEFEKKEIQSKIIKNINQSNNARHDYIVEKILKSRIKEILFNGIGFNFGIGSFRNSSRLIIAKRLAKKGIKVEVIDKNALEFKNEFQKYGILIVNKSKIKNNFLDYCKEEKNEE